MVLPTRFLGKRVNTNTKIEEQIPLNLTRDVSSPFGVALRALAIAELGIGGTLV